MTNTSQKIDPDTDEAVIAAGQRDQDAGHDEGRAAMAAHTPCAVKFQHRKPGLQWGVWQDGKIIKCVKTFTQAQELAAELDRAALAKAQE